MAVTIYIRSSTVDHGRIENRLDVAFIGAALIGAAVGFLWFNAFPAEVFMGDTGVDGDRRRDRGDGDHAEGRAAAALRRRHLRDRGALGDRCRCCQLQVLGAAHLPDRADPAPLRDEGVVGDEDHGALLDRHRDLLRAPASRSSTSTTRNIRPPVEERSSTGLGTSGAAAARLAERGDEVVLVDRSLGNEDDLALLDGVELLVKSPGAPRERPLVVAARERGIPVWSEVELGYRLLPGARFVGVTGTNGKTTTTELLGAIFRAAGRDVAVAGNIGMPLTSVRAADWVVCELSSFQLEDVHEFACDVAVLLNLEPDHLDRHGSFEAYRDAKLRIFERARVKVVPRGLGLDGIEFSADDALPAEPLLRGAHNRENAAAATAAARAAGIDDDAIAEALRHVPRRRRTGSSSSASVDGVRYVNDSKATNVAAALRGARGLRRRARASDSRRLAEGRGLRAARRRDRRQRPLRPPDRAGEADELAAALGCRAHSRDETLEGAVAHAVAARERGRRRPAQPGLRELRPVRELRAPRRRVPASGRRTSPFAVLGLRAPNREVDPGEEGRARVEVADPRHAGAGRVRPGDGLQRHVRCGGGRRQRPELLPEAAGRSTRRSGSA